MIICGVKDVFHLRITKPNIQHIVKKFNLIKLVLANCFKVGKMCNNFNKRFVNAFFIRVFITNSMLHALVMLDNPLLQTH